MRRLSRAARPWAAVGATCASLLVLAPRALAPHESRWQLWIAIAVGFAAGIVIETSTPLLLKLSKGTEFIGPFAAIALINATLVVALGTYRDSRPFVVIAASIAGLACAAMPRPDDGYPTIVRAALLSSLFAVVAPVVAHCIAYFATTRTFEFALTATGLGRAGISQS